MYDDLLKRLEQNIAACGVSEGCAVCAVEREAAAAIRSLQAKLDALKTRPIEEIPQGELFIAFGSDGGRAMMKRGKGKFNGNELFYVDTMNLKSGHETILTGIPLTALEK